jgi:3-methyladenine DNA glycosylase/8-oxoguanine DNA glycosylase
VSIDPIKYISNVDAQLARVIEAVGQYSIKVRNNAFQCLVESIIFQQLAGTAAMVIYERFIKYYNEAVPTPTQVSRTLFFTTSLLSSTLIALSFVFKIEL